MVGPQPLAEITNVPGVKRNRLSSNVLKLVLPKNKLGPVDCRTKDPEFSLFPAVNCCGSSCCRYIGVR